MVLLPFNELGDLPTGVHKASFSEVIARFGAGSKQREAVTARLRRIHDLAIATGALDRLIIFGSYVTNKLEPKDVDVILIMRDDFRSETCPPETLVLFDHRRAAAELEASIFWIRPALLLIETLDEFILRWQIKREGGTRGIVEVKP
ncbi:MAG TPA: hypothetical protein VGZ47_17440 [Gemmataceae bacterium]|jgi:hypothetical protein|nr:hypothetical protein [Gemmataceae bacterium]